MEHEAELINKIRASPLFINLPEEIWSSVQGTPRRFVEDQPIILQDARPTTVHFIIEGSVLLWRPTNSGRIMYVSRRGRGVMVGELESLTPGGVVGGVHAETNVLSFEMENLEFERLLNASPEFARGVLNSLALKLRASAQRVETLAVRSVKGRVADDIIEQARNPDLGVKENDQLKIPNKRQKRWAAFLNMDPSELSRQLKRLEEEQAIERIGETILVLDEDKLMAWRDR